MSLMILLHTAKISSKPLHLPATWQTARPLVPDQQLHFLQRRGKAPGRPERSGAKSCHATMRLSPMVAASWCQPKMERVDWKNGLKIWPAPNRAGSVLHTLAHSLTTQTCSLMALLSDSLVCSTRACDHIGSLPVIVQPEIPLQQPVPCFFSSLHESAIWILQSCWSFMNQKIWS